MPHIKEKVLALYARSLVKRCHVLRTSVGFQQARSIGILYTIDTPKKCEYVRIFAEKLTKMGKSIAILAYAKTPTQSTHPAFSIMTHQDLKFWGSITHPQAQAFVNTPFDYLYYVALEGHPVLDYLLAKSQAKCRVGCYDPLRTSLFEMMVVLKQNNVGNGIHDLTTQMLHCTQLLKT